MTIRSALILLLCLCLALPSGMAMSMTPDTGTGEVSAQAGPVQGAGSDCPHHAAMARLDTGPDIAAADHADGHDPAPTACCEDCDCGCLPAAAPPAASGTPAVHSPTSPIRTAATHVGAGPDDIGLRPPIG